MRESKEERRRRDAKSVVTRIEQETGQCADPLEYLLRIVADEEQPHENRVEAAKASVPYVHPKLANVQHTGANGGAIEFRAIHQLMMDPKAAELAEQLSLALVRQQNELAATNPLIIEASPDSEEYEVISEDARPSAIIAQAEDETDPYPIPEHINQ